MHGIPSSPRSRDIALASLLGLLVFVDSTSAQSALELNRSGRWAEAAEVALGVATDLDAPLMQRCEAYYSLVYADIRLGRSAEASRHPAGYDRTCPDTASGTWLEVEVGRLRTELQPATRSQHDDWTVAQDPAALGLDITALAEHEALCSVPLTCAGGQLPYGGALRPHGSACASSLSAACPRGLTLGIALRPDSVTSSLGAALTCYH